MLRINCGRFRYLRDHYHHKHMFRGKKYKEASKLIDKEKVYDLGEALNLILKTSQTKFDSTVELHIKTSIDPKKSEQQIRSSIVLPHGTGKSKKVAVFAEGKQADEAKANKAHIVGGVELIDEIKKTGKVDFDIAIATPAMMKNLAKVARVLGPKGLMPSPKSETITQDVVKTLKELAGGKITFKNDGTGVIHLAIGKVSFGIDKLQANYQAIFDAVKKAKPEDFKGTYLKTITLATSMGPGIKVKI